MHTLGIRTGADLKKCPLPLLIENFGKSGQYYFDIARGIDNRRVTSSRPTKSVGIETTYQEDLQDPEIILQQLTALLDKALTRLAARQMTARTMTIKIKYHDFVQITRSRTLTRAISRMDGLDAILADLLKDTDIASKKIRLLGIAFSSLMTSASQPIRQMDLFN